MENNEILNSILSNPPYSYEENGGIFYFDERVCTIESVNVQTLEIIVNMMNSAYKMGIKDYDLNLSLFDEGSET